MAQKKLMLLGGLRYLLPVIKAAHEQDYYVLTCDYLPDNIAHKYSDEYVNVSIIDREAVLREAEAHHIDGIMSFACDPGVVSASYVQEKMGLPSFGPYESVVILQNKDLFRAFLAKHGFNVPRAKGFDNVEEALIDCADLSWPVIVKPTDSAGSKGVTRVDTPETLRAALEFAMQHSLSGHIIVEEFIEKEGCSSDCDCFSVDSRLTFVSYNAQRFDEKARNPYAPAAFTWPSTFTAEQEAFLTDELQRLITLLGMKTAVYNVETRVGRDGKPYLMEVSPRGGGNRLCEMVRYATGVDMITAITRSIVGDTVGDISQRPYDGHWAEVVLHAGRKGRFSRLEIDNRLPATIVEKDLWVKQGDEVDVFAGANNSIGTLVLQFKTAEAMEQAICHQHEWLNVVVE